MISSLGCSGFESHDVRRSEDVGAIKWLVVELWIVVVDATVNPQSALIQGK